MFDTLDALQPKSQCVFVRGDLNVPMIRGRVADTMRLEKLSSTIHNLSERGGRVVVLSHLGRPNGIVHSLSLLPVAKTLERVLGKSVAFAEDCIGAKAKTTIERLRNGDICVLENLRFHRGEQNNDIAFASKLAENAEIYVNDAFSVAHRNHASICALPKILPAYIGINMQRELEALKKFFDNPERPVMAIVGGAKVSSKAAILENLVKKVDVLAIGGSMANVFLYANNIHIGSSLCERGSLSLAKSILRLAKDNACQVLLPQDVNVAPSLKQSEMASTKNVKHIAKDDCIFDIGRASCLAIIAHIEMSKTILWNGPLGVFEVEPFHATTVQIAKAIFAQTRRKKLISVVGGGDTVHALSKVGEKATVTHISTAGGAFLEWMQGKTLPGVLALSKPQRCR